MGKPNGEFELTRVAAAVEGGYSAGGRGEKEKPGARKKKVPLDKGGGGKDVEGTPPKSGKPLSSRRGKSVSEVIVRPVKKRERTPGVKKKRASDGKGKKRSKRRKRTRRRRENETQVWWPRSMNRLQEGWDWNTYSYEGRISFVWGKRGIWETGGRPTTRNERSWRAKSLRN